MKEIVTTNVSAQMYFINRKTNYAHYTVYSEYDINLGKIIYSVVSDEARIGTYWHCTDVTAVNILLISIFFKVITPLQNLNSEK